MPNILSAKVLNRFAKQVPELREALRAARMEVEPTKAPPFKMLIRSIVYQQLSGKAAQTIHNRMLELIGNLTPKSVLAKTQDARRQDGLGGRMSWIRTRIERKIDVAADRGKQSRGYAEAARTVEPIRRSSLSRKRREISDRILERAARLCPSDPETDDGVIESVRLRQELNREYRLHLYGIKLRRGLSFALQYSRIPWNRIVRVMNNRLQYIRRFSWYYWH